MKPVFQDSFWTPDHTERGNCWSAALASVLELPLEAVPNFVTIDELGGPDWWMLTVSYLRLLKKRIEQLPVKSPPMNEYYLASGLSPRSVVFDKEIYHVVVYLNGRMVHDPHPEGTGLLTIDTVEVLVDDYR